MAKMKFAMVIVSTCYLYCSLGFAWGPIGHRVVAELAQRNLSEKAQSKIKNILGGAKLSDVALWADDIKADAILKDTSVLHYVDIPDHKNASQISEATKNLNILPALKVLTEFLKTNKPDALKQVPPLSQINKEQALKFLVHFAGDIHQPLHAGGRNDRGGNDFKVLFLSKDYKTQLHHIWDSELIELQQLSFSEYANLLERRFPKVLKDRSKNLDFENWAQEGVDLRDRVYDIPQSKDGSTPIVTYDYVYKNMPVLEERLVRAGARLAKLLNSIFAEP